MSYAIEPTVYILASRRNGTLYIGVTSNLSARLAQHRNGSGSVFVAQYSVTRLVYAERFSSMKDARLRERQLKEWQRAWKIRLIEEQNPEWNDLLDG